MRVATLNLTKDRKFVVFLQIKVERRSEPVGVGMNEKGKVGLEADNDAGRL